MNNFRADWAGRSPDTWYLYPGWCRRRRWCCRYQLYRAFCIRRRLSSTQSRDAPCHDSRKIPRGTVYV